jgi:hypothetical protein
LSVRGHQADRFSARGHDLVENLEDTLTGFLNRDFAQREPRDLRRRLGLLLLVPLGCEEAGILDCHGGLSRYEHDEVEIVRVVRVGFV